MKRLLAVFFTAIILLPLFCQSVFVEQEIDFAKVMPADINVIGGEITCQPVRTSYGYIATGDGKQLYGFTQEGKLLWQRSAKFRLKKFLSVFSEREEFYSFLFKYMGKTAFCPALYPQT